jgi:hypothetical protein
MLEHGQFDHCFERYQLAHLKELEDRQVDYQLLVVGR